MYIVLFARSTISINVREDSPHHPIQRHIKKHRLIQWTCAPTNRKSRANPPLTYSITAPHRQPHWDSSFILTSPNPNVLSRFYHLAIHAHECSPPFATTKPFLSLAIISIRIKRHHFIDVARKLTLSYFRLSRRDSSQRVPFSNTVRGFSPFETRSLRDLISTFTLPLVFEGIPDTDTRPKPHRHTDSVHAGGGDL